MKLGVRAFGLGCVSLGLVGLAFHGHAVGQPLGEHKPFRELLIYAAAAILILGGLAVNVPRLAKAGTIALTAFLTFWTVVLNGPHLVAEPTVYVSWESICEMAALAAGGLMATALLIDDEGRAAALFTAGRLVFGFCLIVFGGAHFAYAKFTATFVPIWLPPGQMFWVFATGVAAAVAGIAVLSGIQARLATLLLTVMWAGFAVLTHGLMLLKEPADPGHWAELCVTLGLMGAAWVAADAFADQPNTKAFSLLPSRSRK